MGTSLQGGKLFCFVLPVLAQLTLASSSPFSCVWAPYLIPVSLCSVGLTNPPAPIDSLLLHVFTSPLNTGWFQLCPSSCGLLLQSLLSHPKLAISPEWCGSVDWATSGLRSCGSQASARFPVRAHAWVAGQVPSRACKRQPHINVSLSFFLPHFPSV